MNPKPRQSLSRHAHDATFSGRRVQKREAVGFAVAVAALGVFAGLFAIVRANQSAAADVEITLRMQQRRHPLFARVLSLASWPGFPPQSGIIPATLAGGLWFLGFRLEALFQFFAWGTSGISFFFKSIMNRARPSKDHPQIRVVVARIGGSSFPSGHVLNYMGVFGFFAYLIHAHLRPAAIRRAMISGLIGLIGLVGPSRIYLGHHWATDVTASYLLGTAYLIGLTTCYRRVRFYFDSAKA
ncbi:MAG: phosphatase PAP2 family protein [Chloroflexota bacterium]|nr:phosphatase PAP2 family protein [Chloroflexota bacterium]